MAGRGGGMHANAVHRMQFASRANPKPQSPTSITKGFEKFAFPKAVALLEDPDLTIRRKAVLSAGELLSTGENRAQCMSAGMVPVITRLLGDEDEVVRERAASCLTIVGAHAAGCEEMLRCDSVLKLVAMLNDKVDNVRTCAFQALVEASHNNKVRELLIHTDGVVKSLVAKAQGEGPERQELALMVLGALVAGGEPAAHILLVAANAIHAATKLLASASTGVRECAATLLACVCRENAAKRQAVSEGAVPLLVRQLEDRQNLYTVAAAASALGSITIDNDAKLAFVAANGPPALVSLLEVEDEKVLLAVLPVIANVAENAKARELLAPAWPQLDKIQTKYPSSVLQRSAAQALQQVTFAHKPHRRLDPSS